MTLRIVPVAAEPIPRFREAADAVLRESRMFAFLQAPPLERDDLVGWCDILVKPRPTLRHSGVLGSRRGRGRALMETALQAARDRDLVRVEPFVRTDNARALRLYEKLGFAVKGVLRRHLLVHGVYQDSDLMSVLYA